MTPLAYVTIISVIIISWQTMMLNLSLKSRVVITCIFVLGIVYLPLGLTYKFGVLLPYLLALIFGLLTAVAISLVSFGLVRIFILVASLLGSLFFKRLKTLPRFIFTSAQISCLSIIIAVFLGGVSFYGAIKNPAIKHYDIFYDNLPAELDGYRIAHISDTHSGVFFRAKWHEELLNKVAQEKVNLIVHTGDIADSVPERVKDSLKPLLKLSAPDGVYYVMGNHENYHSKEKWRKYYQENNLNLLEDEYVVHQDLPLVIAGAAAEARTAPTDYDKLLKDAPPDSFILLLDHYPNRARQSKDYVDLQLSGHTHGGLTFYLAPIIARFNAGFVNGLYNLENMNLFVTSCAGLWSYAPIRLFVPSEIAIIRLRSS